ncbi:MAG: DmsE family decaheme c-type cytochrome [Acidobacteria bacterium]|nr:DmsE family decaheme c-type cytochrome [Acidobacteriota bacterium]
MTHQTSTRKLAALSLFLAVLALSAAAWGTAESSARKAKSQADRSANPHRDAKLEDYVGGEACFACHQIEDAFKENPHYSDWDNADKPWSERGCESCHGPGREHVEAGGDIEKIFNYKKVRPQAVSDNCLTCHFKMQDEQANFLASEHGLNSVACTECHTVHAPHVQKALLPARVPALCYDCHGEVRPEFNKPWHHKVHEGLMSCTDCHNQHGGFNVRQTRDSTGTDQVCIKCHADKQGPFVFEHAPVKLEGCTLCHQPHGSVNPRLLKRAQLNQLCLECHTETPGIPEAVGVPTFHSQTTLKYTSCTTCHVNIHGSNLNRFFFE